MKMNTDHVGIAAACGLAALQLALMALALNVCGLGPQRGYLRADLEKKVKGLTEDQLRRTLGSPDDYQRGTYMSLYTYERICRKSPRSKVETAVIIVEHGRVSGVSYPADPWISPYGANDAVPVMPRPW